MTHVLTYRKETPVVDARLPERWLLDERMYGLSDSAWRLFTGALMWCNQQQTDGVLTTRAYRFMYPDVVTEDMVAELVSEELWRTTSTGFVVADWTVTQTAAADLAARREKSRRTTKESRAKAQERPTSATTEAAEHVTEHVTGHLTGHVTGHDLGKDRPGQGRTGQDRPGHEGAEAPFQVSGPHALSTSRARESSKAAWLTVAIPKTCSTCADVIDPQSPLGVCAKQDAAHNARRRAAPAA